MIESVLTKRKAKHVGEVGLFPDNAMAGDDLRPVSDGTEVMARWGSPRNIQLNKFMWALADKVSQNVDGLQDREDALEYLCVKARFMKTVLDPKTGKLEIRRKSTRRLSNEEFQRLIDRLVFIVCNEVIPSLDETALRAELEAMVGPRESKVSAPSREKSLDKSVGLE